MRGASAIVGGARKGPTMEISVRDDGPYVIRGEVRVLDAEGNELPSDGGGVALCRCGGSETKPFCDGTHRGAGFASAPRAS